MRAPAPALPQTVPVLSSAEEALGAVFPDEDDPGTPLAITDRDAGPPGTALENALMELGEELLRPPEVGRRVRRKFFDSVVEPTGTARSRIIEYPISQDRAGPARVSTEDPRLMTQSGHLQGLRCPTRLVKSHPTPAQSMKHPC